ncbi:hypothetical protein AOCH_003715 [Aspergillus ochraceoroseus]|uniref:CAP-Gly domain-containing protein n=1 Tax=Aspergillus ochraceoroseus TaxID=138278 RepID=A0A0F8UZL7_9EURO|nr:hypothetical protein AOCH_003715 [Aspergillus ochraceoroseus]
MDHQDWVNQRRSYNGDLCTIRYVGKVDGTAGEWLGVEWDDPTRGKHSGKHQGVNYFTYSPRSFLEALREKYASEFEQTLARQAGAAGSAEDFPRPIEFNGKVAEEVGFDKIRKQLAELEELKIVLLDGLRVAGVLAQAAETERREKAGKEVEQTCPKIVELDLSRNLLASWTDLADICRRLGRLKLLRLNSNRFGPVVEGLTFDGIEELHLADTLLPWEQSLRVSGNPLFNQPVGPSSVTGMPEKPMTVDEAYMLTLSRLSTLQTLNYSKISAKDRSNAELYYLSLIGKELSASPETAEPDILAAHPRYKALCQTHGEPLIKRASTSTGPDAIVNPRSVAARLVKMVFRLSSPGSNSDKTPAMPWDRDTTKVKQIPRSFDTYQVKAIVSRLFNLPPFEFRLIWETDELDPVSKENMDIEDEWDSDDEDPQAASLQPSDGTKFVKREFELVDSTKDIGFWFQSDLQEARVRVELTSPQLLTIVQPKYWCKQCKIFIRDTAFEKTQHEATGKHQGNLKRFLRDIHRDNERQQRDSQRAKNEVERLRQTVAGRSGGEGKGASSTSTTAAAQPRARPVSVEERKKQMAQLADMGVAIPEAYRGDMSLAGEWQTVSERVIREEGESEKAPTLGVRKRKHDVDVDEEEQEAKREAERFVSKGWGSKTRRYPGAEDDADLDALFASTKDMKKANPPEESTGMSPPEEGAEDVSAKDREDNPSDQPAQIEKESAAGPAPDVKTEPEDTAAGVVFKKRKPKAMRK